MSAAPEIHAGDVRLLSKAQAHECIRELLESESHLVAEIERLRAALDGSRPLPLNRETLGKLVRDAWVRWARTQSNPKPSWLAPWDELPEPDREADRQIGETIARWTLIHDAARLAQPAPAEAPRT